MGQVCLPPGDFDMPLATPSAGTPLAPPAIGMSGTAADPPAVRRRFVQATP
jgi:hypothetical protein